MIVALAAPATATPDWSKGQQSPSKSRRALISDIHHFAAQVKIATILEECSREYFDFDRVCFLSSKVGVIARVKRGRFSFIRRKRCFSDLERI